LYKACSSETARVVARYASKPLRLLRVFFAPASLRVLNIVIWEGILGIH